MRVEQAQVARSTSACIRTRRNNIGIGRVIHSVIIREPDSAQLAMGYARYLICSLACCLCLNWLRSILGAQMLRDDTIALRFVRG